MKRITRAATLSAIVLTLAGSVSTAFAQTLYDGSLGTTPGAQGWLAFGNANLSNPAVTATETYNGGGGYTMVDSSASTSIYAGYANYSLFGTPVNAAFPTLNSVAGFTLTFTVQNVTDSVAFNAAHPRSDLSVILLDSNHTGVEIGIRPDQIFSQAADFNSVSQSATTALGASLTNYTLAIFGGSYALSSGGTTLLTGSTKQFSTSSDLAGGVYTRNNFVFVGDDTTSDGGAYRISSMRITTGTAAPEPGTLPLLTVAGLFFCAKQYRRRRNMPK